MDDVFKKIIEANRSRDSDTSTETLVLQAIRDLKLTSGTLLDLRRKLKQLDLRVIHRTICQLAMRGKIEIVDGNHWKLVQ